MILQNCVTSLTLLTKKISLFLPLVFGTFHPPEAKYKFLTPAKRHDLLQSWGVKIDTQDRPLWIPRPIQFRAFDIDGNLLKCLAGVYVIENSSGKTVIISNGEFAKYRDQLGKPNSPYSKAPPQIAFSLYRGTQFENQIRKMLKDHNDTEWYGFVMHEYELAAKDPRLARQIALVTSRGHPALDIFKGFGLIEEGRFIQNTPQLPLIFPVTAPEFDELTNIDVPDRKFLVLSELLDLIQSIPTWKNHQFGFSDDDSPMANRVAQQIFEEKRKGRWPFVDITIYWSGAGSAAVRRIDRDRIVDLR